jgi:hypothetical protein
MKIALVSTHRTSDTPVVLSFYCYFFIFTINFCRPQPASCLDVAFDVFMLMGNTMITASKVMLQSTRHSYKEARHSYKEVVARHSYKEVVARHSYKEVVARHSYKEVVAKHSYKEVVARNQVSAIFICCPISYFLLYFISFFHILFLFTIS